ncbi:MAG: metallophosphoesterase [Acidobacteria bacterium]|nr:MAG: metallophosphoesterase [Acidobacteriota bacterium]
MNRRILALVIFVIAACGIVSLHPPAEIAAIFASPQAMPVAQGVVEVKLPLEQKSVRFAVIGDNGTGDTPQYEVAAEMEAYRKVVGYDFVTMMGDNIYGSHKPKDIERKFETPYKPLLDAGVKFYACLGNHDDSNETLYKLFNMDGQHYYSFKKGDVQFFVLDSNYMDSKQLDWIQNQLSGSTAKWKIAYFHHPLYSDGRFHGPDLDLRKQLMPIFEKYGLNVVLSGHDHVYERFKPEDGIYFFLVGNSGELRYHNLRPGSNIMAAGFDTDRTFMLVEISGDKLYFQTVSRTGQTVDSGTLQRQPKAQAPIQAEQQVH